MADVIPTANERFDPWRAEIADVARVVGSDLGRGLTAAEAARRLDEHGPNVIDPAAREPAWRKLLAQFADPLVYVLLAAVAISFVAWVVEGADGVPFEVVVILVIVVLNAVFGYVQESRAERAVAALQRMAAADGVRTDLGTAGGVAHDGPHGGGRHRHG